MKNNYQSKQNDGFAFDNEIQRKEDNIKIQKNLLKL